MKRKQPSNLVILAFCAVVALLILSALILPNIGSIPPGYFGGW